MPFEQWHNRGRVDHSYIEERGVVRRYLDHTLTAEELADFEGHLVDCVECADRLLLAEMFHVRNGRTEREPLGETRTEKLPEIPLPARFVAQFKPWQLLLILVAAAMLLLLVPVAYFLWARV